MKPNPIKNTWICTECSAEVQGGIQNFNDHLSVCTYDAPSSSIEAHKDMIDFQTRKDNLGMTVAERQGAMDTLYREGLIGLEDAQKHVELAALAYEIQGIQFMSKASIMAMREFEDQLLIKYNMVKA
jgi:hypothetical protein